MVLLELLKLLKLLKLVEWQKRWLKLLLLLVILLQLLILVPLNCGECVLRLRGVWCESLCVCLFLSFPPFLFSSVCLRYLPREACSDVGVGVAGVAAIMTIVVAIVVVIVVIVPCCVVLCSSCGEHGRPRGEGERWRCVCHHARYNCSMRFISSLDISQR